MATLAELAHELRSLKGKTLITFHSLGDVDSVCSALVLQRMIGKGAEVRKLDTITAYARHVLQRLKVQEPAPLEHLRYNNLVLVDVSTPILLGEWTKKIQKFKGRKLILDHHLHKTPLRAHCYYNDPNQPSTGEIVYRLSQLLHHKLDERQALLLLASVLHDTAYFKSATTYTFEVTSALLHKTSKSYPAVRALLSSRPDVSERMARLRAGQRATLYHRGDFVVATSVVNAFELTAATSLIEAGADVAFVANERVGRLSGAKGESVSKVNIAKIMEKAGRLLGGSGGGHENVGGAQGKAERLPQVLSICAQWAAEQAGVRKLKKL